MAHARLYHVEQNVIDNNQKCFKTVSCSSFTNADEETETIIETPKSPLILTVRKNGKEYSVRRKENKSTKRPSNKLEETNQAKRRHLDDFPLVLTPVCSSIDSQSESIYSPILFSPTPCAADLSDITTELTTPITPKSSYETSSDEFSQSDAEELAPTTRNRSNSNIVRNASEVSTPIPLTSSTTPFSSTCSTISSQYDSSCSSPSSPSSSCHTSKHFSEDKLNDIFNSWMDCYEEKKKKFLNTRNKV